MREIKFRAWDSKDKCFAPKQTFAIKLDGKITALGGMTFLPEMHITDVQQYTGLTTNGVEIYEGDIIENDAEWWQVVFDEGKFLCQPIKGGNVWMDLSGLAPGQETWVQGNF